MAAPLLAACMAVCFSSCSYLKYSATQAEYSRIQEAEPGMLNLKHMIDRETFFVHGRNINSGEDYAGLPMAISAFSSNFQAYELVDTMHFSTAGSHFGLTLPPGQYELVVFTDINENGVLESSEAVGTRSLDLDIEQVPGRVLGQVDVELGDSFTIDWDVSIEVPVTQPLSASAYYPSGTIRSLDDPIFDTGISTMGMYDPAAFLELAPALFYALEEDLLYKIPVVFVHGIAGSAREFEHLVGQLDRDRYKPWFFHYPSGGDLEQLGELFYQILLSGEVYESAGMPVIIIAHSMGGLVVREALNKYHGKPEENQVHLFISLASPFGGHAAAASGEKYSYVVLPSWRDLNPDNDFIREVHEKPMPDFVQHELIFAYQNPGTVNIGENSDGVVALTSQLHAPAQQQASGQFGFASSHTGILQNDDMVAHIQPLMAGVQNKYHEPQLKLLHQGGYDVALGDEYTPLAQYVIRTYGKYLMALTNQSINASLPSEEAFVSVVKGEKPPRDDADEGWLRFISEYPELRNQPKP